MTLNSVRKVDRIAALDIHYASGSEHGQPKIAPVVATYEVIIETAHGIESFDVEIRITVDDLLRVDWGDDLDDALCRDQRSPAAWDAISQAVFARHTGQPLTLPVPVS